MGITGGIVLVGIGAVLRFALSDQQAGPLNLGVVGIILMITGAAVILVTALILAPRRRSTRAVTTTTPDGQGGFVRESRRDEI